MRFDRGDVSSGAILQEIFNGSKYNEGAKI
jgi:hypothetical protein